MNCSLNNKTTKNVIPNYSKCTYLNSLKNLFYYILIGKTEIRELKKNLLRSLGFNIQNLFLLISNQSISSISLIDFETYLNNNNIKYKESVLKRLIRQYDKNGNFNLSFDDFYNFVNYPANIMIKDNITHKITETQKKIFSEILINELEMIEKIGEITSILLNDINFTCYEAFMKISNNKKTFNGNDLFSFLGDEFDYDIDIINDVIYFMDKKGDKMITYEEFQDLFLPLTHNNSNKVFNNYSNMNNNIKINKKKFKVNVNDDNYKTNDNNNNKNDVNVVNENNYISNFNDDIYNENNYTENNYESNESSPNKNCSSIVTADFYKNKDINNIDSSKKLYQNLESGNNCTDIVIRNSDNKISKNGQYFDDFNKIAEKNVVIDRNLINENNNLKKYFILENNKLFFKNKIAFNNHINQISYLNNQTDKNRNKLNENYNSYNDNNKLISSDFSKTYSEEIKKDDNNTKYNFTINNCNSFSCINQSRNENSEIKNVITNENQFSIEKDIENLNLIKNNINNFTDNNISNKNKNNIFSNIFSDIVHNIGNNNNNHSNNNYKIELRPEEEKIIDEYNNLNEDNTNNFITNNIFNNSNYIINKNNGNMKFCSNIPDNFINSYCYKTINFKTTKPFHQKNISVPNTTLKSDYSYQRKHLKYFSQKNLKKQKNNKSIENIKINEEEKNNNKSNYVSLYQKIYSKVKIENKFPSNIIRLNKNKNNSINFADLNTNISNNKSTNTKINQISKSNDYRKSNYTKHHKSISVISKIKDNDFSLIPTNEEFNYNATLPAENNLYLINSFIDFMQLIVKNETEIENLKDNFSLKGIFALKSLFNLFDKDVNNSITEESFRTVCRTTFGLFPTKDQIFLLFRRYDNDKDGKINLRDFLKMICPIKKEYMTILYEKNKNNNFSGLTKKGINYFSELLKCLIEKETQYYLFKCKLSTQQKKNWFEIWKILIKNNSFSFHEKINNRKICKNDLKLFFEDNLYFLTSYQIDLIFHFFGDNGNKGNERKSKKETKEGKKVEYITYDEFINVLNLC